jgi:DNA-binding MarR family transcriptional regulator
MQSPDSKISPAIVKAVLLLARRLRSERPEGAAPLSLLSLLGTLHRLGEMPAARLAAEERLQPQSLTRMIGILEENDWIARRRSDADRREILIAITPEGKRVLSRDIEARRVWLEGAMADTLDERQCAVLMEAAEIMLKLAGSDHGRVDEE